MDEQKELEITRMLRRYRDGDPDALDELLPFILDELKRLARRWLTSQNPSWQPTSLVNEMFVHLLQGESPNWNDRQHFFNAASQQMRHLMIDHVRRKMTEKRGEGMVHLPLDDNLDAMPSDQKHQELLAIHDALREFEQLYPRAAKVVEMRFFIGLDELEIAQVFGVTERTIRRDWVFARAWLQKYLLVEAA